jgi:hypothetical protein
MQHPDETLATYGETYANATSRCCNIYVKHMQHPDKTLVTYV